MSRPERKEKPVLFRIPEFYLILLDGIVNHSKGKFKSRNDLVIEILHNFYKSLDEDASASGKRKSRRKKNG